MSPADRRLWASEPDEDARLARWLAWCADQYAERVPPLERMQQTDARILALRESALPRYTGDTTDVD